MSLYKKMYKLLNPSERRKILFLLFPMIIGMILEIASIGMVIPAIAVMTKPDIQNYYPQLKGLINFLGNPSQPILITWGMLALVGLYLLKTLFLIYLSGKQNKLVFNIRASLSYRLFEGYLQQPWTFHLQRNSAQLTLNATTEVNELISHALLPGILLITEGLILVGIVIILFVVQPYGATLIVGTVGLTAAIFQRLIRKPILNWGEARQYHDSLRVQYLQQGLGGAKDVKLLGRESEFFARYHAHNLNSSIVSYKQKTLLEFPRLWLELLAVIGLAILVLSMVKQGNSIETLLPTLGLFAAAAFRVLPSANRVLGAIQCLRYGLPIINSLYDEINILSNNQISPRTQLLPFASEITMENVSYSYPSSKLKALKGINLRIPYGASVGFIGASGSGKSTLIDILLGLLTPIEGAVKIDKINIETNLRGWQDQIGYVPQSIFLSDDSIEANIAFGLPQEQIDSEAISTAVKLAQLDDFISSLPEGLKTPVGERGVRLSGGQRQRIGIARALYHDPKVLVLDEATSALDIATELEVMEAVNALHGHKTLIIVAHRLSTLVNCDYLYSLDKGCIVRHGTYQFVTNDLALEPNEQ